MRLARLKLVAGGARERPVQDLHVADESTLVAKALLVLLGVVVHVTDEPVIASLKEDRVRVQCHLICHQVLRTVLVDCQCTRQHLQHVERRLCWNNATLPCLRRPHSDLAHRETHLHTYTTLQRHHRVTGHGVLERRCCFTGRAANGCLRGEQ
jgi:hypothetical protein